MDIYEMLQASQGATFSECRKYRYVLWRIWDFKKPPIMFIGLNPSTANEKFPDRTISRVIEFGKSWGYGGIYMMNLFPFVTKYPSELEKCSADQIRENDKYITEIAKKCADIIFAWGTFPVMGRDREMIKKFPKAKCLLINDDGSPQHPLYVPGSTKPILYIPVK